MSPDDPNRIDDLDGEEGLVDVELRASVRELQNHFDAVPVPPLARPASRKSLTAPILTAAALVCAVVAGALLLRDGSSGVVEIPESPVATEPETASPEPTDGVPSTDPENEVPVTTGEVIYVDVAPPAAGVVGAAPVERAPVGPPATGATVIDPAFGTEITRITASGPDQYQQPLAAAVSSWNIDATRVLLYRQGGEFVLYDAAGWEPLRSLDIDPPDIEQVYWSRSDPSLLYYVEGADLIEHDVEGNSGRVRHTFAGCDSVSTGDLAIGISLQNPTLGLTCEGPEPAIMAYRFATDEVVRVANDGGHAPTPTASGTRFVLTRDDGSAEVLDAELNPTGVSLDLRNELFAMAVAPDGSDVLVATMFEGEVVGTVVTFNLDTGQPRAVIGPNTGFPFPPTQTALSVGATGAPGRIAVSIVGESDVSGVLGGEVLIVDLGDDPTVVRLAHHRSTAADGAENAFFVRPYVSISPDGDQLLFSSDWENGTSSDTFVIDLAP